MKRIGYSIILSFSMFSSLLTQAMDSTSRMGAPVDDPKTKRLNECKQSTALEFELTDFQERFCKPYSESESDYQSLSAGLFCLKTLKSLDLTHESALIQCHWFFRHPTVNQTALLTDSDNKACVEKLADFGIEDFTVLSCEKNKLSWTSAFKTDSFSECIERTSDSVSPDYFRLMQKRNFSGDSIWKYNPETSATSLIDGCLFAIAPDPLLEKQHRELSKSVRFLGSFDFHADDVYFPWWVRGFTKRSPTPIEGLSGLTYSTDEKRFFAVNDSKSDPRLYEFKIDFNNVEPSDAETHISSIGVTPKDTTRLRYRQKTTHAEYDFEDLVLLDSNQFLMVSEPMVHNSTDYNGISTYRSLLSVFNREGKHRYDWKLPEEFLPKFWRGADVDHFVLEENAATKSQADRQRMLLDASGVRNNLAFEALTQSPDKTRVFFATEQGLRSERKLISRIQVMSKESGGYFPTHQYIYPLDNRVDNGLSALTALSSTELLALERSYDSFQNLVTVNLYYVELGSEPSSPESPKVLTKKLLLAFDSVVQFLPAGVQTIDNLEGMTLGPRLDSGEQTLVLVSDNNENPRQRTQFLAFALNISKIKQSIIEREEREHYVAPINREHAEVPKE